MKTLKKISITSLIIFASFLFTQVTFATVNVNVTANPTSVSYNGTSTISWTSTGGATSCNSSTGQGGTGASGSFSVGPLTSNMNYSVSCHNGTGCTSDWGPQYDAVCQSKTTPTGCNIPMTTGSTPNPHEHACIWDGSSSSDSASVSVAAPVFGVNVTATPSSINSGGISNIAWTSVLANSCVSSTGQGGNGVSGNFNVTPTATSSYSVTCTRNVSPGTCVSSWGPVIECYSGNNPGSNPPPQDYGTCDTWCGTAQHNTQANCNNAQASPGGQDPLQNVCEWIPGNSQIQTTSDSATVNVSVPVNGSCSATHYSCVAGTSANNNNGTTSWTWNCNGSNGGTNASCVENKAVNGSCGPNHYLCTTGTSTNQSNNSTTWTWDCSGSNGGTNASCSEAKNAPTSGTLSATNCVISQGNTTCNTTLIWNTVNPVGTSSVTTPTNITVATANSSSGTAYSISSGSRNFYLYNSGTLLATATATATTGSGSTGEDCSEARLPDLTAGAISPTTSLVNTPVNLSATITNIGSVTTGTSFWNFMQVATTDPSQSGGNGGGGPNTDYECSGLNKDCGTYQKCCTGLNCVKDTKPQGSIYYSHCLNPGGGGSSGFLFSPAIAHAAGGGNNNGNGSGILDLGPTLMPVLAGGASDQTQKNYTFNLAGTYWVRACADKKSSGNAGTITEGNENNNCGPWTTFVVTPSNAVLPDLVASATGPTSALVNTPVTLSSVITNIGNATTGAPFNNFFQISDLPNGGGNKYGPFSSQMNTLGVNQMGTATATYTFRFTGNYYVQACADQSFSADPGTINELNELNNCSPWTNIIITTNIVNGACSPTHFNCTAGVHDNMKSIPPSWTWDCKGLSGGTTANCSELMPTTYSGVCGPTHYNCILGTSGHNRGNSTVGWKWDCAGAGGGGTDFCFEPAGGGLGCVKNGIQEPPETGIDCGGPSCPPCQINPKYKER